MLTLDKFGEYMRRAYGAAILKNADYYAFFVNLCQREEYVIGGDNMHSETFLDDILKDNFRDREARHFRIIKHNDGVYRPQEEKQRKEQSNKEQPEEGIKEEGIKEADIKKDDTEEVSCVANIAFVKCFDT